MKDYKDIPNAAKAYAVVGILLKTIVDQIENPSIKAGLLRQGCGRATAGFRIKAGAKAANELGNEVKDIWRLISDDGKVKFNNDNPDYLLALFCKILDPKDFKAFFLVPVFRLPMKDEDVMVDKYSPYALRLLEELVTRYNHPRPKSKLVYKKVKKNNESKELIKLRKAMKKKNRAIKKEMAVSARKRFNTEVKTYRMDTLLMYKKLIDNNSKKDLERLFEKSDIKPDTEDIMKLSLDGNVRLLSVFVNPSTAMMFEPIIVDIVNHPDSPEDTISYLETFVEIV